LFPTVLETFAGKTLKSKRDPLVVDVSRADTLYLESPSHPTLLNGQHEEKSNSLAYGEMQGSVLLKFMPTLSEGLVVFLGGQQLQYLSAMFSVSSCGQD